MGNLTNHPTKKRAREFLLDKGFSNGQLEKLTGHQMIHIYSLINKTKNKQFSIQKYILISKKYIQNKKGNQNPNWRHGLDGIRINQIYYSMIGRCKNKNSENYTKYGGRGIKCLWNSFEKFKDDMYESYIKHVEEFGEKQTTIERIDNNGNYCKENCRWATQKEQASNKRNTLKISFNGEIKTLKEWAKEKNIGYMKLFHRIKTLKWTPEKSLNTP